MNRRDFVTVLVAFCLTATLFLTIPTKSQTSTTSLDASYAIITANSTSILFGESVLFNLTHDVAEPWGVRWYVNSSLVSDRDYFNWTYQPSAEGVYIVWCYVVCEGGGGAQSNIITLTVSARAITYDPWADINDDGIINMYDVAYVARRFGLSGEPIDKTCMRWYYGLVGYWKLDEGTGNIAVDSSGNSNNGILINDPIWVEGKYGKALNLSGNNYVEIADSESLRVQNFTLEAWIYMTKRPYEQSSAVAIINKFTTDSESSGIGYMLLFENPTSTDDNLVLASGYAMAGERILVQYNSTDDLPLNMWHHVVGTFDGYTATVYIDGILRKSMMYSEHIEILYWKSVPSLLGAGMSDCLIDNVMIYNRTLSAQEVMTHYLLQPP